jgi:hypothetical protein
VNLTLADLARKYRVMVALRERHDRDGDVAPRDELRALATEFPSALRELDRLPMETLRDRARAVDDAARDPHLGTPWMQWMLAWHALMAAALATRRALGRDRSVTYDRALTLAARASDASGIAVDVAWVQGVASRPEGGLTGLVYDRLADHFSVSPEALREGIFPGARARLR